MIVNLCSVDVRDDMVAQEFYKSYLEDTVELGSIDWWHSDLTFIDLVPNYNESIGNLSTNEDRKNRVEFVLKIPK